MTRGRLPGRLLLFRGWVEYPEGSAARVRETLDAFVARASRFGLEADDVRALNRGWTVPELQLPDEEREPFASYAFLGLDRGAAAEPLLRAQVEALAGLWEWDGPLRRFSTGRIEVEEDDGSALRVWRVAGGTVAEEVGEPRP